MFYNNGKPYDLTMYIDAFNNEIVAYDLSEGKHCSNPINHLNALKMLLKTIKKRGYINLETIVHSDQGAVYSSTAFNQMHTNYTIKRSMSRVGTPTDNPIIESLNGWIKNELYLIDDKYGYYSNGWEWQFCEYTPVEVEIEPAWSYYDAKVETQYETKHLKVLEFEDLFTREMTPKYTHL